MGITEAGFREVLHKSEIQQITAGHLRLRCRLLGGFEQDVDFHFRPRKNGRFDAIEIFRKPERHRRRGFDDWEVRLIRLFGEGDPLPQDPTAKAEGIVPREWRVGRVRVAHDYHYLSGLVERVSISH